MGQNLSAAVLPRKSTAQDKPVLGLAFDEQGDEIADPGLVESAVNGVGDLGNPVLGHVWEGCAQAVDGLTDQPVFFHPIHG